MQKKFNDILLDTHVFLWLMNGDKTISPQALESILEATSHGYSLYVSAISI